MQSEIVQIRWELFHQMIGYKEEHNNFHEIVANWKQVKAEPIKRLSDLKFRCKQFHELNMTKAEPGLTDEERTKNMEKIMTHRDHLIADLGLVG